MECRESYDRAMAKVRIRVSLDPDEAERVRFHAERAGMDLSSYLLNAAICQMADAEGRVAQQRLEEIRSGDAEVVSAEDLAKEPGL